MSRATPQFVRTVHMLVVGFLVAATAASRLCEAASQPLSPASVAAEKSLRQLLLDSGVTDPDLASFSAPNPALGVPQLQTISRILYRLQQLELGQLSADAVPLSAGAPSAGQLIEFEGRAKALRQMSSAPESPPEPLAASLFSCEIVTAAGKQVVVLTPHPPQPWLRRTPGQLLDEPVTCRGVRLGSPGDDQVPSLVVANRLEWRPTTGVPAGAIWLASRGYDVALFDDVRQHRPFAKPEESRESTAFYDALATIADSPKDELARLARQSIAGTSRRWASRVEEGADQRRRLSTDLQTAPRGMSPILERQLAELRREQTIATKVAERAKHGLSSAWPMFLAAEESVGEFFLIEGTARRAVRIVLDEPVSSLTHYYELDVFPPDSQNQPVICCVARLPRGFPQGDVIRQPVRVAGIFFKRWSYLRRPEADPTPESRLPARLASPLLLASEPEWLPQPRLTRGSRAGLWAGIALLLVVGVIGITLAQIARRDRLARTQRARYDAPQDDLANL